MEINKITQLILDFVIFIMSLLTGLIGFVNKDINAQLFSIMMFIALISLGVFKK